MIRSYSGDFETSVCLLFYLWAISIIAYFEFSASRFWFWVLELSIPVALAIHSSRFFLYLLTTDSTGVWMASDFLRLAREGDFALLISNRVYWLGFYGFVPSWTSLSFASSLPSSFSNYTIRTCSWLSSFVYSRTSAAENYWLRGGFVFYG